MSLSQGDLLQISTIVQIAIEPLVNEIAALRNDVKELYWITARLDNRLQKVEKRLANRSD